MTRFAVFVALLAVILATPAQCSTADIPSFSIVLHSIPKTTFDDMSFEADNDIVFNFTDIEFSNSLDTTEKSITLINGNIDIIVNHYITRGTYGDLNLRGDGSM